MRFNAFHIGFSEQRCIRLKLAGTPPDAQAASFEDERLDELGGLTRTKESSIGAATNLTRGALRLVFKRGERLSGAAQMAQGALDAFDIVPSAAADVVRGATGPQAKSGTSPYNYNISRAFGSVKDVKDPLGAVGAAADVVHALGFKLGSDALKAARKKAA